MLELASRLGEGASALVDPHVAVDFVLLGHAGGCGNDAVDVVLEKWYS